VGRRGKRGSRKVATSVGNYFFFEAAALKFVCGKIHYSTAPFSSSEKRSVALLLH
jgi:hypothetical protein